MLKVVWLAVAFFLTTTEAYGHIITIDFTGLFDIGPLANQPFSGRFQYNTGKSVEPWTEQLNFSSFTTQGNSLSTQSADITALDWHLASHADVFGITWSIDFTYDESTTLAGFPPLSYPIDTLIIFTTPLGISSTQSYIDYVWNTSLDLPRRQLFEEQMRTVPEPSTGLLWITAGLMSLYLSYRHHHR